MPQRTSWCKGLSQLGASKGPRVRRGYSQSISKHVCLEEQPQEIYGSAVSWKEHGAGVSWTCPTTQQQLDWVSYRIVEKRVMRKEWVDNYKKKI